MSLDEAWELFRKMVGRSTLDSHPCIAELVETWVRECRGLPLALKTLDRAMKSQRKVGEWDCATKKIGTSAFKFLGMEEKLFSRLKFSRDRFT